MSDWRAGSLPSFAGLPVVLDNDPRLILVRQVEVDVGPIPVDEFEIDIVDTDVKNSSKLFATMSWDTPTGKESDDVPMDSYVINVNGVRNRVTLRLRSLDGLLHDTYRVNYIVG